MNFTLYSRSYCHLCDDMLFALKKFANEYSFSIKVVDIDADQILVSQYDELVPVLVGEKPGVSPLQLCHYFLDEEKVRAFLQIKSL